MLHQLHAICKTLWIIIKLLCRVGVHVNQLQWTQQLCRQQRASASVYGRSTPTRHSWSLTGLLHTVSNTQCVTLLQLHMLNILLNSVLELLIMLFASVTGCRMIRVLLNYCLLLCTTSLLLCCSLHSSVLVTLSIPCPFCVLLNIQHAVAGWN